MATRKPSFLIRDILGDSSPDSSTTKTYTVYERAGDDPNTQSPDPNVSPELIHTQQKKEHFSPAHSMYRGGSLQVPMFSYPVHVGHPYMGFSAVTSTYLGRGKYYCSHSHHEHSQI